MLLWFVVMFMKISVGIYIGFGIGYGLVLRTYRRNCLIKLLLENWKDEFVFGLSA
jgi:hypothetical protein